MRVALASDHAGFEMKGALQKQVAGAGHQILDLGACSYDPTDDYPDFAAALGDAIASGQADRGILICGSGVGASIAANKVRGARAGLCHDTYSAHQGVEHDDMNILVLGSRIVGSALASELTEHFLSARFSGEERHRRRLAKVEAIESRSIDG